VGLFIPKLAQLLKTDKFRKSFPKAVGYRIPIRYSNYISRRLIGWPPRRFRALGDSEIMSYAAIDILNDVVLGVGSMAACEEFVRVACVEAKNNGQPYSDEDTPSVSDFSDMDKYYQDLVIAHCEENNIGLDGWR